MVYPYLHKGLLEHLWEVVDVSSAVALGLEALQLEVVFSHVGRRHREPVVRTLTGAETFELDLGTQ